MLCAFRKKQTQPICHFRRAMDQSALKILYLDQNKWIDLARAVKFLKAHPDHRVVLEALVSEANAGHIAIPLTASNIYETHKIDNKERRDQLAWVQATLS